MSLMYRESCVSDSEATVTEAPSKRFNQSSL